ncbi:TIGR01459 family HAD-type hydrolase, partial [Mesorhizobium sp. M7A.F.Ca.AU.001.01.1.1]
VEHDISGGNSTGIATALVLSGILADTPDLAAVFDEQQAWPDYIMDSFSFR